MLALLLRQRLPVGCQLVIKFLLRLHNASFEVVLNGFFHGQLLLSGCCFGFDFIQHRFCFGRGGLQRFVKELFRFQFAFFRLQSCLAFLKKNRLLCQQGCCLAEPRLHSFVLMLLLTERGLETLLLDFMFAECNLERLLFGYGLLQLCLKVSLLGFTFGAMLFKLLLDSIELAGKNLDFRFSGICF